jgi:hypothetical protein
MKKHLWHLVLFYLLVTVVFNGVWWIAVPLAIWYMLQYSAYELVLAGFCIDVYFAPTFLLWYYTLAALGVVIFGLFIRPRVRREHSFVSFVS